MGLTLFGPEQALSATRFTALGPWQQRYFYPEEE